MLSLVNEINIPANIGLHFFKKEFKLTMERKVETDELRSYMYINRSEIIMQYKVLRQTSQTKQKKKLYRSRWAFSTLLYTAR